MYNGHSSCSYAQPSLILPPWILRQSAYPSFTNIEYITALGRHAATPHGFDRVCSLDAVTFV